MNSSQNSAGGTPNHLGQAATRPPAAAEAHGGEAGKAGPAPSQGLSLLILQAPQSRFPKRLGQAVRHAGGRVTKVNVCGGDVLHWPGPDTVLYRGARDRWPGWIATLMRERAVTDLLLLGDRRPMNHDAIRIARVLGIRIWVLEEGYLRPNHITLEENGVNTRSSLPATPEAVRLRAAQVPTPVLPSPIHDSPLRRLHDTIVHHVGNALMLGLFPRYRTHRPYTILWELTGILPRFATRKRRRQEAMALQQRLLDESAPYFLFPLQLDADTQVRSFSHYGVRDSIMAVLSSFAAAAPRDCLLVAKNHPLDNGLINLREFIQEFAAAVGIADRVRFLDGGQGRPLMQSSQCQGVVVVNSTMGLEALTLGRPVFSLGQATYAMPGLAVTAQECPLGEFWASPRHPDPQLLTDFVRVLHSDALVPGNFYTAQGIEVAVAGCLARLGAQSENGN